jgi:hypothetical protein
MAAESIKAIGTTVKRYTKAATSEMSADRTWYYADFDLTADIAIYGKVIAVTGFAQYLQPATVSSVGTSVRVATPVSGLNVSCDVTYSRI